MGTGSLAAEAGSLTATFTTTPNGGQYAPNHVVAVWVEGPGGTFVKTIGRWSAARTSSLVGWRAKAGTADVDAVSGATINSHTAPLSITWDLKDRNNTIIVDGTYTLRMELADSNAAQPAQNHQGTFTFVKGATAQMQSALTNGGFTNVSINIDPAGAQPPPSNPPPSDPPPSGGGDAGLDNYDAVQGGCVAGAGSSGLATFVILGAIALLVRRRPSRD